MHGVRDLKNWTVIYLMILFSKVIIIRQTKGESCRDDNYFEAYKAAMEEKMQSSSVANLYNSAKPQGYPAISPKELGYEM